MAIEEGEIIEADDFRSKTLIPRPTQVSVDVVAYTVVGNTTLNIGQILVPRAIKVNKLSIPLSTSNVTGTFKVALYSEDGQTKILEFTTVSISTANDDGILMTTLGAEVNLAGGVYYIAILPVSTASCDMCFWTTLVDVAVERFNTQRTGEPVLSGTLTVVADTMPATIDPTAITGVNNRVLTICLDN